MGSSDDWTGKLAAPRRNRYSAGRLLSAADLELEQRYGMHQRWLMNRVALGTGVVCGLQVSRSGDGQRLLVTPGVAVDPLGREIVVPEAQTIELHPAPGGAPFAPGRYQVCVRYREYGTDRVPTPDGEEAGTTVESFALELRAEPPATPRAIACDAWLSRVHLAPQPGTAVDHELLAARLAALLKATCAEPPADAAVALGIVVIGGAASAPAFEDVRADGRMCVYSHAELVEMVLCLAERVAQSGQGESRGDEPAAHAPRGAAQRPW